MHARRARSRQVRRNATWVSGHLPFLAAFGTRACASMFLISWTDSVILDRCRLAWTGMLSSEVFQSGVAGERDKGLAQALLREGATSGRDVSALEKPAKNPFSMASQHRMPTHWVQFRRHGSFDLRSEGRLIVVYGNSRFISAPRDKR